MTHTKSVRRIAPTVLHMSNKLVLLPLDTSLTQPQSYFSQSYIITCLTYVGQSCLTSFGKISYKQLYCKTYR